MNIGFILIFDISTSNIGLVISDRMERMTDRGTDGRMDGRIDQIRTLGSRTTDGHKRMTD